MHRLAVALSLMACASAFAQGGSDLMASPACLAVRQQLDEVLAAGGPRARLDAVRRQAALSCFGLSLPENEGDRASAGGAQLKSGRNPPSAEAPRNRVRPPPVAVDPIRLRPSTSLPLVSAPPSPSPLPPAPIATTACDAAGCWDSNGARHNIQGPVLIGPRGACIAQAGLLNCP